jgi:beta-lactamase class A
MVQKFTLSFLSLTFIFFLVVSCDKSSSTKDQRTVEIRKGANHLINPLLDCYDFGSSSLADMKDRESLINKYVEEAIKKKEIFSCSVYFRKLDNGHWIGINEKEHYAPASLLKVPFMMAALRQAEQDPTFLSKKVLYQPFDDGMVQNITDKSFRLVPGQEYTIEDLINYMIIYSDNVSKDILIENLLLTNFYEAFFDLGIDIDKYGFEDNFLTVKDYATYFRMLYNATYLSKDMSNKALDILTKTTFKSGISAGVPNNVIVAHKFGERTFANSPIKQLHEGGIIYMQNNPYILVVMVKGKNFNANQKAIQDISRLIYNSLL